MTKQQTTFKPHCPSGKSASEWDSLIFQSVQKMKRHWIIWQMARKAGDNQQAWLEWQLMFKHQAVFSALLEAQFYQGILLCQNSCPTH
jgi:hypothetical protein